MKQKIFLMGTIMVLTASLLQAQDRMNNRQISIFLGGQSVPKLEFTNLAGAPIATQNESNKLPWNFGFRAEREYMVNDLLGWGWCYGLGIRHTGWNVTIPKGTQGTGLLTGLPQDADGELGISLFGISGDVGLYGALHLSSMFEVFGSLGVSFTTYWEMLSSSSYDGRETTFSGSEPISGKLLAPYALLGAKYTFNEDYFISLSCRYSRGFSADNSIKGDAVWDTPFHGGKVEAPFVQDITVMLGVGIMMER